MAIADQPQHMTALAQAEAVRLRRANIRREVRQLPRPDAYERVADLILECPPELKTVTVGALIEWLPRVGGYSKARILQQVTLEAGGFPVSEVRPLHRLTLRQAMVLATVLRERAAFMPDRTRAA